MPDWASLIERGLRYERAGVLDQAMRSYQEADTRAKTPDEQAEALRRQADVMRIRCNWDEALELAGRSEAIATEFGLVDARAEAINGRAAIHQSRGSVDSAGPLYEQILTLPTRQRIRGNALQNLGVLAAMRGDHDRAAERFEASVTCFEAEGYSRGVAIALNNLGRASLDRRDFERAEDVLERAVTQARRIDDLELTSVALVNLAEALLERGEVARAEREASEALGFFNISGNLWRQVECLRLLGDVRSRREQPEVALRLYRQALSIAEQIEAGPEAELLRGRIAVHD